MPNQAFCLSQPQTAAGICRHADLCCYTVLFYQRLLGEVDLERVICAQADIHPTGKEGGEGVAMVIKEQAVVGQGTHTQAHLQISQDML